MCSSKAFFCRPPQSHSEQRYGLSPKTTVDNGRNFKLIIYIQTDISDMHTNNSDVLKSVEAYDMFASTK